MIAVAAPNASETAYSTRDNVSCPFQSWHTGTLSMLYRMVDFDIPRRDNESVKLQVLD